MVDTSKTNKGSPAPPIITKETEHPLSVILLGEVVGAAWLGSHLVLYYADGHKTLFQVDDDGDINVQDYQLATC